jgi:hypothetical protein
VWGDLCATTYPPRTGLVAADGALGQGGDVRTWASEARRRRAEFLAALGAPAEEVEAELERALAVASAQGASLLELRAATGLLRHHQAAGGDRAAVRARERLEAVIAALPERGDTPDLREAAALLARP